MSEDRAYNEKSHAFEGFEIWSSDTRMTAKMYLIHIALFLATQGLIFSIYTGVVYGKTICLLTEYLINCLFAWTIPSIDLIARIIKSILLKAWGAGLLTFAIWYFFPVAINKHKKKAEEEKKDRYIEGARKIEPEVLDSEIQKRCEEDGQERRIPIANILIPARAETPHVGICGGAGSGKTQVIVRSISALLDVLKAGRIPGAKIVIYDTKGDIMSSFFEPGKDLIFNPLDERCLCWSVFNDIQSTPEISMVGASLVPMAKQEDPFWNDGARAVFCGLLHYLDRNNARTNADIWHAVAAPTKEVLAMLQSAQQFEAIRYIEDASSKQALGVMAKLMQYAKCFDLLRHADGDFSVKKWLADPEPGIMYVQNYRSVQDTLRPALSLLIDLLAAHLAAMEDSNDRRVFFFLDEFGTLQRLPSIIDIITFNRSKGASAWLGFQNIGRIDERYSNQERESIMGNLGTHVVLNSVDVRTQKHYSDMIGDTKYRRSNTSISMGSEDSRDSRTIQRQPTTEKLVMPSMIGRLRKLEFYLKVDDFSDWTKTRIQYKKWPVKHKQIELKKEFDLAYIQAEEVRLAAAREIQIEEAEKERKAKKAALKGKMKQKEEAVEHEP